MKPTEKSMGGWYFLIAVIIIYFITFIFKPDAISPSLQFVYNLLFKIIPILFLIFVLMALINYFMKPNFLIKYLGKTSGIKGWIIAIGTGILSAGPIYMWYPLLSDLQHKGMRNALIAAFLYNRAVKPALMPLMIVYFGLAFTLVLAVVMIFASVAEGWIVEKLMEVNL